MCRFRCQTVSEAWPQTDEACYPYPETRAQRGVWEARKHPPSCGTMNRAPCAVFGLPASGPSPTRQPPLLGTQRRPCCYGMPAAALLMRQGNERWVAYRFLPPNAVQLVAHILAVSPFSTFDPRLPQEGGELQIRLTRTHPFQLTRGSLTEFGGPRSLPCSRDRGLPLPCPPAPRRTPGAEPCHHYNIPAKARKSQFNESTGFRT